MGGVDKISRVWAMPNSNTFRVPPIAAFVEQYMRESTVSIDPFSMNALWATHTNDINPNTSAEHHMDSLYFLEMIHTRGITPDLAIFDPPYSPEQLKRAYNDIEKKMTGKCALRCANWPKERNLISELIPIGGVVLSFGWDSNGMGKKRGFTLEEILLVCHGGGHNDTICIAERKTSKQLGLFCEELIKPRSSHEPHRTP